MTKLILIQNSHINLLKIVYVTNTTLFYIWDSKFSLIINYAHKVIFNYEIEERYITLYRFTKIGLNLLKWGSWYLVAGDAPRDPSYNLLCSAIKLYSAILAIDDTNIFPSFWSQIIDWYVKDTFLFYLAMIQPLSWPYFLSFFPFN